jgi:hypothetical protein
VEEYYVPSILHEEGQPLLDAQRRAEADIWELGGKTLTAKQLDELRDLIEQWRREHPTQYYVGLVRLADIAAAKQLTQHSPQVKLPGSVFGLLYLDPLSGLDPVAAEMHSYRALTERFMYLATRMPMVFGMQIERATDDASSTPEMQRFLAGVDRFNDTIARFTDVTGKYPQQLSGISVAAIDQTAAAVTAQRKAILAELEAQESRLRRITDDVNGVLDRADRAGVSINAATTQTVTTTEQATRRTMDRAFWLALTLILVLLIGIPLAAMLHRFLAARDSRRARGVTSASSP